MHPTSAPQPGPLDTLVQLAAVIESRKPAQGRDLAGSYVAQLLHQGSDAVLKKIGEEAAELIMAAKDADHGGAAQRILHEMADLWFHCLVALAHYDLQPQQVAAVLQGRAGTSGIQEKALRQR